MEKHIVLGTTGNGAPRLEDWPDRLAAFIEQRRRTPFAWGTQDCCQFARGALQAQTGVDPTSGWNLRPYKTERGAAANLARIARQQPRGDSAAAGLSAAPLLAGLIEIPVPRASRGDLVLCHNGGREALGVCLGHHCAAAGADGLVFFPTLEALHAWRIT